MKKDKSKVKLPKIPKAEANLLGWDIRYDNKSDKPERKEKYDNKDPFKDNL